MISHITDKSTDPADSDHQAQYSTAHTMCTPVDICELCLIARTVLISKDLQDWVSKQQRELYNNNLLAVICMLYG